jgi:alkanesulfonate monooxygenase SsuD/methylene tetrahydromethanopterin reductase-like flavin-dependent oxidoreductase (luciferase family)
MAAVTKNLVFGIMESTTCGGSPILVARCWSTSDHLPKGSIGWNMVTAFKRAAFKVVGMDAPIEHDERYLQVDEYIRVLYK